MQGGRRGRAHVHEPLDPVRAQAFRRDRSHAPQRVDRQVLEERLHAFGAMTVRPSGLRQPEAILARNLLGATPADAVRPVCSRMASFIRLATSTPSGSPQPFSVTSR